MGLHPQAREILSCLVRLTDGAEPAGEDVLPAIAASRAQDLEQSLRLTGIPEQVAEVADLTIPSAAGPLPLRTYVPCDAGPGPWPMVLYIHGGGWTVGSLDTHDGLCRALANAAGAMVVAAEYRLAPEQPFPAALEDCWSALTWMAERAGTFAGDGERLALAGDSAGANLATVLARRARDRGGPPVRFQALAYPATDAAMDSDSYRELGVPAYGLTREAMALSYRLYLGEHDRTDPDVSPLRCTELAGLPPALVLTAEYDPLRDEGESYAERLREAGVEVTLNRYAGMPHGFLRWRASLDASHVALEEIARALRRALG